MPSQENKQHLQTAGSVLAKQGMPICVVKSFARASCNQTKQSKTHCLQWAMSASHTHIASLPLRSSLDFISMSST